ncbi:MAG: class I SAM-dependent methyltransferase [Betaproteobacteria bacterium]|nr:class I SAM-dependent methyltransferase [Betaproteobacteria bacterium]
MDNPTIDFFDAQFRRQVVQAEFALNPFEQAILPFASGRVLDLGCGLGNLALAAARRGASVLAVDGSPSAVAHLAETARREGLALTAVEADVEAYTITEAFDTIVCIGLLMFFPWETAYRLLEEMESHLSPGGRLAVNVLVEGTTYLDMFSPGHYYLFGRDELAKRFQSWDTLLSTRQGFEAPGNTRKEFVTLVTRRA